MPVSPKQKLVQIVDAALADAERRSGKWLACRLGCTQCCVGVFAINSLDAERLREGLAKLQMAEPARASRLRERVQQSIAKLSSAFPGDPISGLLAEGEDADQRFAKFANDEVCPVLDPETGLCDLYSERPVTCRVFGPPVRSEDGLGVCELCFVGASDQQIAAGEINLDEANRLEEELLKTMPMGRTVVAFALAAPRDGE